MDLALYEIYILIVLGKSTSINDNYLKQEYKKLDFFFLFWELLTYKNVKLRKAILNVTKTGYLGRQSKDWFNFLTYERDVLRVTVAFSSGFKR